MPGVCRWAVELVSVLSFAQYPQWRWPATKAVMATAGAPLGITWNAPVPCVFAARARTQIVSSQESCA